MLQRELHYCLPLNRFPMLQSLPNKPQMPPTLSSVYDMFEAEMKKVDEILCQSFSDDVPFVNEVSQYAFQLGGKRLRPAITLVSHRAACPGDDPLRSRDKLMLVATAIEMVHTATLIHDDILDGALIRRHLPTMHTHWNAGVSVMAGDVIFTKALDLVTQLDELEPYRALANACHKTCYGELRQMGTRNRFDLPVDDYLEIVTAKTAALIECSSRMGAWYAGADAQTIEQFRLFGREIGITFQIVDDVLDLVGDENTMGKSLGTDILYKKPTLPVLMYLDSLHGDARREAIRQCSQEGTDDTFVQNLVTAIQSSGAVEAAMAYAENLTNSAAERIRRFAAANPRSPESQEAADALVVIADFVVKRVK
ncbi:MAG: polyprenyl synthetase family protein [Planctomycetaceae bacterium]|nr:polyprenyl synthetase family protein [Planctomycetaceae bacterium]